jgi:hypothetical protein
MIASVISGLPLLVGASSVSMGKRLALLVVLLVSVPVAAIPRDRPSVSAQDFSERAGLQLA